MTKPRPQILLTNDDGILSPGLWAAAASLSKLGFVTVTAPREQSSGAGRSMPNLSDGIIQEQRVQVNNQEWSVFAVGGSPAQTSITIRVAHTWCSKASANSGLLMRSP